MTPAGHPKKPIPLMKRGDKRLGSAAFYNELISTCNAIRRLKVVKGTQHEFLLSDDNATLAIEGGDAGPDSGSGWFWADPKEYNETLPYFVDEVVMVSPANSAVGTVVVTGKKVVPGIYVCVKDAINLTAAEMPCWPMVNMDPDHASNFWIMLSIYPSLLTYCLDGVDTDFYVNAQPK